MAYQIEYAYTCHMGRVRANNEDNFWCCGEKLSVNNQGLEEIHSGIVSEYKVPALAVFDGMGGESYGEMAAFLASEEFGRYYEDYKRVLKSEPLQFMEGVCKSMNQAVCGYGEDNRINSMGTTVAMSLFTPESIYICNLGDSRVYLMDEENLSQVSTDHVLGGTLFGKSSLTQYLGMPEEQQMLEPSVKEMEWKEGCRYLLCSDGITDMLSNGEIAEILREKAGVKETVEHLLNQALEKGGKDNITIVLGEIQKLEYKCRIKNWLRCLKNQ